MLMPALLVSLVDLVPSPLELPKVSRPNSADFRHEIYVLLAEVESESPGATVKFSAIKYGDIGTTYAL